MNVDSLKKAGAVACGVVFILALLTLAALAMIDSIIVGIVLAAIMIVISAAMAYYVRERCRELDEGLEDAIDDY